MWPEVTVKNISEFISAMGSLDAHWPNRQRCLFRGQALKSWNLQSSLLRLFHDTVGNVDAVEIEQQVRHAFRNEAHRFVPAHYIPDNDHDLAMWWPLMRHYGAPTRILDWSLSPYVALYFAVHSHWEQDGAVWFVRAKSISAAFKTKLGGDYKKDWKEKRSLPKGNLFASKSPSDTLYCYEITRQFDRIAAQQGWFTICCDPLLDHATCLERYVKQPDLQKFVIPADQKPSIMRELHLMNITAKALFPGTDGLGRSMEEIARLSVRFTPMFKPEI